MENKSKENEWEKYPPILNDPKNINFQKSPQKIWKSQQNQQSEYELTTGRNK